MEQNELEKILEQDVQNAQNEPEDIPAPKPVKKKKKHRRRRKRRPIFVVLFLALIVFLCFEFLKSDYFTLVNIEVEGNSFYTPAKVIEISEIQTGWNLFSYDYKAAKAALLDDPYIKLASIKPVPPDSMLLSITEREEYACIPYGEEYIVLDREGLVLRITDTKPVLPVLDGMTVIDMTPGSALTTEETYLLSDTLDLLSVVDEYDIYFKEINFSTVVVKAYIRDKLYCEGTPANIMANMSGISKLAQELYTQDVTRGIIKVGKDNYLSFNPQVE